MEGYIKSKMTHWMHIFKTSVRPGGKIPLADLYDMYGKKHNIKEEDFVDWLKNVKLQGKLDCWEIVEKNSEYIENVSNENDHEKQNNFETNNKGEVVARKLGVEDVVDLSVRKAREVVPTIMDIKLLKYALLEARPRAGKDSLCKILEKRINELSLNL